MKISDIIDGIAIKIDSMFDDATIYVDKVPQGFIEPCFVVKLLNFEHIRMVSDRWLVQPIFNVMYFPSDGGGSLECYDVSLEIQQGLSEIELIDETIMISRGTDTKIIDGEDGDVVGHNFMRFDFFLRKVGNEDFMEQIKQYVNKQRVNNIV